MAKNCKGGSRLCHGGAKLDLSAVEDYIFAVTDSGGCTISINPPGARKLSAAWHRQCTQKSKTCLDIVERGVPQISAKSTAARSDRHRAGVFNLGTLSKVAAVQARGPLLRARIA